MATETMEPAFIDSRPTLRSLAATYVPFGLGVVVALLAAEFTQNLRLFRTIYSIRLSMGFSLVALGLFPSRRLSAGRLNAWRLTWTFGFLAYLIHFLYAWFGVFGGQVATANRYPTRFGFAEGAKITTWDLVVQHQGEFILYSNLIATGLWALDVLLAWMAERARGFFGGLVSFIHVLAWLDLMASFGVSTLVLGKNSESKGLGYVLAIVILFSILSWLIGLMSRRGRRPHH